MENSNNLVGRNIHTYIQYLWNEINCTVLSCKKAPFEYKRKSHIYAWWIANHKFSMLLPLKALSYNSKFLETKIGNHFEQPTIINFIRLFPLPFPHFTSQTPTNIRFELPFYYFVCTITIRFYEHKGVKGCGRLESNCGVAGPKNNANYICSKKLHTIAYLMVQS